MCNLFQLNLDNKTLIILITSIIWAINFRSTFKSIDSHMDSGSYASLKFDPVIILVKNILNFIFYSICFYIETSMNKGTSNEIEKKLVKKKQGNLVIVEVEERKIHEKTFGTVVLFNQLKTKKEKFFFCLKLFSLILIIYVSEELYFLIANNHIMDRLICPSRNMGFLISILFFSRLLIKKTWALERHQYIPLIIIVFPSLLIFFFNMLTVDRFQKVFNINGSLIYFIIFLLMGLEMVLIKYLIDIKFISIFLILGIKGLIGTIIFIFINAFYNKDQFFDFIDDIIGFEYEDMNDTFSIGPKILYLSSLLILQYLIMVVINHFSESHILSVVMITDIIYFPFYCIERFVIEDFGISTLKTFYFNIILGFINAILMLIFNEILECKFWGLDLNIKKNIKKRIEEERLNFREFEDKVNDNEDDIVNSDKD